MTTAFLLAMMVLVFVIAPIYLVRLHNRLSNTELMESERRHRLDNPDWGAMQKFLRVEVPQEIVLFYSDKSRIHRTELVFVDALDSEVRWEIQEFIAAHPKEHKELSRNLRDKFCFAKAPFGTYYVDIKSSDPRVYICYDLNGKTEVAAPSFREFIQRLTHD